METHPVLINDFSKRLYIKSCALGSYRKSLPQFKATMPPHKWMDNAELSVPDQMTNITEKTRPQSYLQLSRRRPNTQNQFNTLGFTACITLYVCVYMSFYCCADNFFAAVRTFQDFEDIMASPYNFRRLFKG